MVGKINSVLNFIDQEKTDVISLNETRTNSTTEAYIYEIAKLGYMPFIRSRKLVEAGKILTDERESVEGGVALLIRDTFSIIKEHELTGNQFTLEEKTQTKLIGAKIKIGEKEISIFSFYNAPNVTISEKVLNFINKQGDYILVGDLNARMTNFGDTNRPGSRLEQSLT